MRKSNSKSDGEYGTFLRLKRRANIPAATSILLEGLRDVTDDGSTSRKRGLDDEFQNMRFNDEVENDDGIKIVDNVSSIESCHQPRKRRPALWKLVSTGLGNQRSIGAAIGTIGDSNRKTNCFNTDYNFKHKRIVTAMLEETSPENLKSNNYVDNQAKRRKIAILDESTTSTTTISDLIANTNNSQPPKKKGLKILHPLERMVDESLKEVFSGDRTPQQHLDFVSNDSILIGISSSDRDKWLLWSNVEYGNLLHACATWNDVDTANDVLVRIRNKSMVSYSNKLVTTLAAARNNSGQTPFDVANLSGHTAFCDLLIFFGAVYRQEDEYEYDLYYLLPENQHEIEIPSSSTSYTNEVDTEYVTCELQNGQTGYWNEDGELVLELDTGRTAEGDPVSDGEDGDEDSNRESWAGNDYPDEEEVLEDDENEDSDYGWSPENYADDDSSNDTPDKTFRSRRHKLASNQYDSDGFYDPAYGVLSSQQDEF